MIKKTLHFGVFACLLLSLIGCEKHTHTFSDSWSVDANNHWHAATCEHVDEKKDEWPHSFSEWIIDKEPEEEVPGRKHRICSVCHYVDAMAIEALPHTHKFADAWTSDATNHWHAATCEHADLKQDEAPHSFTEWVIDKEAAEEVAGSKRRTCTICEYVETEVIEALPHTHKFSTEWVSDGITHWHPATCEHTTEKKDEEAHSFSAWSYVKYPTQSEAGQRKRTCSVCEYIDYQEVSKLNGYVIRVFDGEQLIDEVFVQDNGRYVIDTPTLENGYYFNGFVDVDNNPFAQSGIISNNANVYIVKSNETYKANSFESLKQGLETGVSVIEITDNITLTDTLYVDGQVTLTAKQDYTLLRDPEFGGDAFVIGINEDGYESTSMGHRAILNIQPADGHYLTFNGNSSVIYADATPTVSVYGSMLFAESSAIVNIYEGTRIIDNRKVDNDRSYEFGNSNAVVDPEDEPYLSSPERVGGAAIASIFAEINIYGGWFENNEVNNKVDNSELVSTVGGVIFSLGTTTIYDGSFVNNKGLYGSVIYSYRNLFIYRCLFEDNYAYDYGTVYMPNSQYAELNIDTDNNDVIFRNNTSGSSGGAIFGALQAAIHINGAIFDGNTTTSNGGAIACKGILTVSNCSFLNNTCGSKGGAIYTYYGAEDDSSPSRTTKIINSTFSNNTGSLGGAVGFGSSIDDTSYPNYVNHVIAKISGCTFTSNHAVKNSSDKYGHGACIYATNKATCEVENTTFKNNDAVSYGGVAFVNGSASLTIKNSSKALSNSASRGGVVYVTDGGALSVVDSVFESNSTTGDGGAIYGYTNSSITLDNVKAYKNTSATNGGFMYMSGAATCNIYDIDSFKNSANKGGFIYITTTNTTLYIYSGSTKECTSTTADAEGIYSNTNKTKIYIKGTDTKQFFDYDGALMSGNYVLGGID